MDRDTKITASFALGHAYDKHSPKTKADWEKVIQDAQKLIDALPGLINYTYTKMPKLPAPPASESQKSYVKSLLSKVADNDKTAIHYFQWVDDLDTDTASEWIEGLKEGKLPTVDYDFNNPAGEEPPPDRGELA